MADSAMLEKALNNGTRTENEDENLSLPIAAPFFMSCRFTLCIMCFFATFNMLLMRINISFAMVCMVNNPAAVPTVDEFNSTSDGEYFGNIILPTTQKSIYAEGEFDWDKDLQGALLGAFFYGYTLTQIIGGWLSDRFGGKVMLIGGLFCVSILTLLNPVAARIHPHFLFTVRVLQGVTQGFSLPPIIVLFSRWTGIKERALGLSIAYAGFPLGSTIIFPLSSFLCQYGFAGGWPSVFYVTGVIGLIWCFATLFLVYDSPELHPRISSLEKKYLEASSAVTGNTYRKNLAVPWRSIATSIPVYTVVLTHFFCCWGIFTLLLNIPTFMKEILKFDVRENGLLSALPYLANLIVHLFVGCLFDALNRRKVCSLTCMRKCFNTLGLLVPGVSMLLMPYLMNGSTSLLIANVTIGQAMTEFALMGGYLLSCIELAPHFSGMIMGITNTIGVISGFACPAAVAALTPSGTEEEWSNVFYLAAGAYFVGAVIYISFGSAELQPWATPNQLHLTNETMLPEIRKEKRISNHCNVAHLESNSCDEEKIMFPKT